MKENLRSFIVILVLATATYAEIASAAVAVVGPVAVTRIRTGWLSDAFGIETGQTIVNPMTCSNPDAYMSDATVPGYKTYYAAALMALAAGKKVTLIISDVECCVGRPKIMGVSIDA